MEGWVQILSFTSLQDAYIAKSYLESEGIEKVFLQNEITSQVLFNMGGGVKMVVNEEDKDRAVELLKEGGFL